MQVFVLVLGAVLFYVASAAKTLPENYPRCKEDDASTLECLLGALRATLPLLINGDKSLGVLSLDPLEVTHMNFHQANDGPAKIDIDLMNEKITGFKDLVINEISGSTKLDTYHLKAKVSIPKFELIGDYKASGRILLLPLSGHGGSNLTLVEMDVDADIMGKPMERKGEKYLDVTDFKLKIEPKRLYMYFENLLNTNSGDTQIGDHLNDFLNQNWELIYKELQPSIEETFGAVLKDITNRIYSRVPYKNIVL